MDKLNPQIDQRDNYSQHNAHDHNQLRTLRDYTKSTRTEALLCIVFPRKVSRFNFKLSIIQLLLTFHGLEFKNSYLHLRDFKEVCNIKVFFFFIKK